MVPPPPPSRREAVVDVLHGVEVADPYRWLEDGESPEVATWVAAQNARTRACLDGQPSRATWHARVVELLGLAESSACRVAGPWVFALERSGGQPQHVLVVRSAVDPSQPASTLLDPAALSADGTAAIDWYHPSPDGRLVAYGVSEGGDENSVLRVLDVATGAVLADTIPHARAAAVAWTSDAAAFAYTRYPEGSEYGRAVWWHELGTDPSSDSLLWQPDDEVAWPEVLLSADGRWIAVLEERGWSRTDVHVGDRSDGSWRTAIVGIDAATFLRFSGGVGGEPVRLVGHTTLDAPRGKVVAIDPEHPEHAHWHTLVAESDRVVERALPAGANRVVVASTRSAVSSVDVVTIEAAGAVTSVPVDLPACCSLAGLDLDATAGLAFVQPESFTHPAQLARFDLATGAVQPWSPALAGLDPSHYTVRQERYRSTDGTEVGLFLVHRADVTPSPDTPCALNGYGGFAIAKSPLFNPAIVAWCEAGGLWAVAGIRGGAEEGEAWHRAGMREHKQQCFDDFAAAAEHLHATGRTQPQRLALTGGSNGGLLVGACLTQRPGLMAAVHCAVPLLDMVRYHQFLIARLWIPEYGDPDVAEEFAWLHAYSPYHHVDEGTCYPSVLLTTAEEDTRVDPLHARKMAALLQWASPCEGERPVLLRVESRAGHGVGKPLAKQADEVADVLAFLGWRLGAEL